MKSRQHIKTTATPRSERLKKMQDTAKKMSALARKKIINTKRINVTGSITRQLGIMTIPKAIETKGTIMSTNGTVLTVKLSGELMRKLKDIYAMTERDDFEYAGLVECSFDMNYANFNSPTIRTNRLPGSVYFPRRTAQTKLMYHSHPAPTTNSRAKIVTFPSAPDLRIYVNNHQDGVLEANLILDQQGVYIIDVVRPINTFNADNMFETAVYEMGKKGAFDYIVGDNILAMNVDIKRWKTFINSDINSKMITKFGVSVMFYTWNELPTVRISALSQ
jgi:hypothetical protein